MARIRSTAHQWLRVALPAGIATRFRKPHTQIDVSPGRERAFLDPLPPAWLQGLDRKLATAVDALRRIHGEAIVRRAREISSRARPA